MTDWLATPVPVIWAKSLSAFLERVATMSDGRAPEGFGRLLFRHAMDAQVDARVALALALKETGRFDYGGSDPVFSADPSFNNYGGIKTTDGLATQKFPTIPLGVRALVAHLAWYAHTRHIDAVCGRYLVSGATEFDPRHWSWGHSGRLRTVGDFGNSVWNTGDTYAGSVARLLAEMALD